MARIPYVTRGGLRIVADHLTPGGRFHLPFQPLDPDTVEPTLDRLAAMPTGAGFTVVATPVAPLPGSRVGSVIADYRS